jgi:hypothetical protein
MVTRRPVPDLPVATGRLVDARAVLDGCDVDVVGLALRLTAVDEPRAGALAALLRSAGAASTPPAIDVRVQAEDLVVPDAEPGAVGNDFEVWRPEPEVVVLRHRLGLTARTTIRSIEVGGDASSYHEVFRRTFLTALAHLLTWHDRRVLHSGAIATPDAALLVLGGSGAGKSSLALCARRGGWQVLADDLVALRGTGDDVTVAGVPRPLWVPGELLDDPAVEGTASGDWRARVELAPDAITLGWHALAGVIVVDHADGPAGTLEPVGGHELLRIVLESWTPIADTDDLRRVFPMAADLARRPAVRLRLGADVHTRVVDAVGLLNDARSHVGLGA